MFNEPTNHPLIPRKNNVIIEKKHVTIHTEDRDTRLKSDGITPVENQNNFSIQLPDHLENISYVQLKNIQIPTYYINISEKYKNNKIIVSYGVSTSYTVAIPDGFYTPLSLLSQLYSLTFKDYGSGNVTSFIDPISLEIGKLIFSTNNTKLANASITLSFNNINYHTVATCNSKISDLNHDFSNTVKKWGLGYTLGFDKCNTFTIIYDASGNIDEIQIDNETLNDGVNNIILVSPQNDIRLDYLKTIYLEVNDFNVISEKKPDNGNRNDTFNNGYYGTGGAALAKIPVLSIADGITPGFNLLSSLISSDYLETRKVFLNSFDTRVHKLNFKFRDHNGSLIDFNDQDFTFTLEFGLVREVPNRSLNILNFT